MARKKRVSGIKRNIRKHVPLGIRIISILNYIAAVICLLLSIFFVFLGVVFLTDKSIIQSLKSAGFPFPTTYLAPIMIVIAILMLVGAVLSFFIGRGLWKGQNWARIVEIVFSAIGIVIGIISLASELFDMFSNPTGIANMLSNFVTNLLGLLINALVAGYLIINHEAKRFFEK